MLSLKLGVTKADITPNRPLPLAGFGHRKGDFEGISRPLRVRVLLFEQDLEKGKARALIVSADLIWWGQERIAALRRQLRERYGLEEAAVILHATHTHSSPQTSDRFTRSLGSPDPEYLESIESGLLEAVDRARLNFAPVTVHRGCGECRIGVNRRRRVGGEVTMKPDEDGPTDPEVNVIQFRTRTGRTKALLVHYACHPTTTGDNLVSSEFPGVAMDRIERRLGNDAVAAYLQGCCGDVRPALVEDGNFYRGGDAEVCELGGILADSVFGVLNHPMQPLPPCPLGSREATVSLALQKLPTTAELEAGRLLPGVVGEWSRLLLGDPERRQPNVTLELTLLDVACGLSLLSMNGEVVVEYGLLIKQRFAGRVLPVPYSNGMIGYVPTARQVAEGGYEARESCLYFGLPAPFDPSLDARIHEAVTTLVEKEPQHG